MGCTSSTATAGPPPGRPKVTSKAAAALASQKMKKSMEIVEVSQDDSDKMKEDLMQRKDSEVDLSQSISAERESLKAMSSKKIVRKLSFEDLMDSLTPADYEKLVSKSFSFKIQKEFRIKTLKRELAERKKGWVVFNNLEAITDFELTIIGVYLISLLKALNLNTDKITLPPPKKGFHSSADIFKKSFHKGPAPTALAAQAPITAGPYLLTMEEHIRDLPVVTIAPMSHYQVSSRTLYDYELPPGLVTINEAAALISLFKRGGRLHPRSVHKLLRLGYKLLKQQPNITPVTITHRDKLIVVGDIHGQLADLFHILDAAGLPSKHTKYIFNGDFVDRGDWGLEVMCILLALFVARPDCVTLNRGNHEDFAICSVYGFQLECYEKYDPLTFSLFVEVFQQIPLFATINDTVFVVHGGLFHSEDITLEDLNLIDRTVFTLEDLPENGEGLDPISRRNPREFFKQLTRDALWSDPVDMVGLHESVRGAGVAFGPDITRNFLACNNLKLVIRSHECIRSGYDEPFTADSADTAKAPCLCTIFSASDYGGSGNSAAYIEFHMKTPDASEEEVKIEFTRSSSMMSVDSSGESAGSTKRRSKFARPSLSIKSMSEPSLLLSTMSTEDNTGDIKQIEDSPLFYQVHYFYAEPLQFGEYDDEFDEDRHTLAHIETTDDLLSTANRKNNQGSALNYYDHNLPTVMEEDTNTNTSLSDQIPPALQLPKRQTSPDSAELVRSLSNKGRRISFGGTTLIVDEEHHDKEKSLVNNIDPTSELMGERSVVLGSAMTIEELIVQRKQLLLEGFEKCDHEGNGLISQKDWMRVMFEILNISISWRKLGSYLVRVEDRVHPKGNEATEKEREKDREQKALSDRMDRLQRRFPTTTEQSTSEDHFFIKYNNFLSRFEDEDTKEKRKEQDDFTMAILKRFQSSNSSLLASSSTDSSAHNIEEKVEEASKQGLSALKLPENAEKAKKVEEDPNMMSLKDYNRLYGTASTTNPTSANNTGASDPDTPIADDKHYFGYEIPEYVIASIYSSYKQIEHVFLCLDEDKDGFFNLQDLQRLSELVKVQDRIQQEAQGYPMIKNIRFSAELIMHLMDINRQDCIDMNSFFEVFRLSILNKLYDHGSSKPLLARETSYAVELHRLTHANSILFQSTSTSTTSVLMSPSLKQSQYQSALSSLELKKGIEISVDNELTMANDTSDNVGLAIDI